MVVTEPDIIKMIQIIYLNLEENMAFINGKSNDFVFHISQSDTKHMTPFELKIQELNYPYYTKQLIASVPQISKIFTS